jgi:hypothetical protein
VIASRQTLLSTYLLYQTLAYMGRTAGAWLASLDGSERFRKRATGLSDVLGGIDVQARDARDRWVTLGSTRETGPLATDVRVVVLRGLRRGTTHLRLSLAKGHWRIDQLTLVGLHGRAQALALDPVAVSRDGADDVDALRSLLDSSRTLVTTAGDEYTLTYRLPEDFADRELFLESRGYYLEWMRHEWLADENPQRAAALFLDPRAAMRDLAPRFKALEPAMEQAFWSSRYVRH